MDVASGFPRRSTNEKGRSFERYSTHPIQRGEDRLAEGVRADEPAFFLGRPIFDMSVEQTD